MSSNDEKCVFTLLVTIPHVLLRNARTAILWRHRLQVNSSSSSGHLPIFVFFHIHVYMHIITIQ